LMAGRKTAFYEEQKTPKVTLFRGRNVDMVREGGGPKVLVSK